MRKSDPTSVAKGRKLLCTPDMPGTVKAPIKKPTNPRREKEFKDREPMMLS